MLHISNNIKKYRELRNMTQAEVADKIGEKRTTYAEWEKRIVPKANVLEKISKVLGVTIDELMTKSDEKADQNTISSLSALELAKQNQAILMTILSAVSELISEQTGEDRILLAARLNKVLGGYLTKVKQGDILEQIGIGGKES